MIIEINEEQLYKHWNKETKDLYMYVDGNNIAITKNSPFLCKSCYIKRYGNK